MGIMDDIGYLSLSKAASKLDVTVTKLIHLATTGKISLSVPIPDESNLWLMSVRKNKSHLRYKQDLYLGGINLFPKRVHGAVLINLSKKDCSRFEFSDLRQGTFESIYKNDYIAHCFDSNFNYLE